MVIAHRFKLESVPAGAASRLYFDGTCVGDIKAESLEAQYSVGDKWLLFFENDTIDSEWLLVRLVAADLSTLDECLLDESDSWGGSRTYQLIGDNGVDVVSAAGTWWLVVLKKPKMMIPMLASPAGVTWLKGYIIKRTQLLISRERKGPR